MQWQFGSLSKKGWPGTLFQNVVPPPQLAGLSVRANCWNNPLLEPGTRITSPLWYRRAPLKVQLCATADRIFMPVFTWAEARRSVVADRQLGQREIARLGTAG